MTPNILSSRPIEIDHETWENFYCVFLCYFSSQLILSILFSRHNFFPPKMTTIKEVCGINFIFSLANPTNQPHFHISSKKPLGDCCQNTPLPPWRTDLADSKDTHRKITHVICLVGFVWILHALLVRWTRRKKTQILVPAYYTNIGWLKLVVQISRAKKKTTHEVLEQSSWCVFCSIDLLFDYVRMRLPFNPWSIAGVPSSQALPGFLTTAPPSVLVPAVLGALAVWIQHPKKIK